MWKSALVSWMEWSLRKSPGLWTSLIKSVIWNMVSLLCDSVSGSAQRGDNAAARPLEFCPGGSCPTVLTLMPDTSVFSPGMPLVPFQLLPWGWSPEWVCVSPKSIVGPLRGDSWKSRTFFYHSNPYWFSLPEVMRASLPGCGTLGWVAWSGVGTPHSSAEELDLCSQDILPNIYPPHMCVGPARLASPPPPTNLDIASSLYPLL